jgi:multiple sugar transport system permease protein
VTAATSGRGAGRRPRLAIRHWTRSDWYELRWALLFLSPWIVGTLVFMIGPMLWSLFLSFTNYDPLSGKQDWIGLANYEAMLGDRRARAALFNTVYFAALYVPASVIGGLGLALMLNRIGGRAAGLFRTIFYMPNVTPAVAVGALFLLLLANPGGVVNQALAAIGIEGPSWLNDPAWMKNGIVLMMLWSLGGTVVILFAALRNVPVELYEAARIDGAGAWHQLRHVTLPLISGPLFFVIVINTIAALQLFAEVYAMFFGSRTGGGNDAVLFFVIYVFRQAFEFFKLGYASALAWVLFVIVGVITFQQFRIGRRFVYYEGG